MTDVSRSRQRVAFLIAGVLGLAALLVLRAWMPAGPSTCLMYLVSGVPCPGCGMTRATCLLARGDVIASLRMHPLALAFALQAGIAWAWWGLVLFRGARVPSPWWGIIPLGVDVVALAVAWLIRYASGTLPR